MKFDPKIFKVKFVPKIFEMKFNPKIFQNEVGFFFFFKVKCLVVTLLGHRRKYSTDVVFVQPYPEVAQALDTNS